MKKILLLLLTTFSVVCAFSQSFNYGRLNATVGVFNSSAPLYQYRGNISVPVGIYTTLSIDSTWILVDDKNYQYSIDSIVQVTPGTTATIWVTSLNSPAAIPSSGKGAVVKRFTTGLTPHVQDGSNFITPELQAKMLTTNMYYIDSLLRTLTGSGITGVPGNTQDTVVQAAHGFSLLDPVFVDTNGVWLLSNISDEDSCHMAIVTEVISADTIVLTYNGLTDQPGHSYLVGRVYFVQDDGTYATTVPTNFINDIAFYVISDSTLYITEQRIVSPMTDLNGIYSGSDTIPSGTIATAGNFQFKGEGNDNYYFSFNPENDNVSMRGDSAILYLGVDGAIIYDNNASKRGLEYAASGYVTQPLSLTTKEYVDSLVSSVEIPDGDKGDIIVSGSGTVWDIDTGVVGANELASTAVTPGSYGNSTNIPTITIDADGRITAAANTAVSTHDPVTVTDGTTIDLTLSTQNITAEVKPESIAASHIDTSAVGSSEIQDYGIQAVDLDTGSVNSLAILDGTITTGDLAFTVNGGSGTTNYMTYWSGTNTLAADVDFTFDGTNAALGTNIVTGERLNIRGATSTSSSFPLRITNSDGASIFVVRSDYQVSIGGLFESGVNFINAYNSAFYGNLTLAPTGYTKTYKLNVSSNGNPGSGPLSRFGWSISDIRLKNTTIQQASSGGGSYSSYPAIMVMAGASSIEFSPLSTSSNGYVTGIIAGVGGLSETSGNQGTAILALNTLNKTPDLAYNLTRRGIHSVSENLLTTLESSDEDLAGSTQTLISGEFSTKITQNFTNGYIDMVAVRAIADGISTVAGANATNNIAIYATAQGGTTSNWSIYSDEGNHYYEDDSKFGGSVATPTARVEIEGSGTTSATYGLQVENSSGANIVSVRDDRYVAFGATTGGSIVEMFTDASRKTYFDGFDILMYNRGSGQNQFGFFGGNGSLASPTNVAAGENLGEIAWYGYYNTADRYANVIRSKVDSVAGSTVWGRLEFNYGSSTPMVTMYGKNNLTQVHGRLGVTSRTGTATSIAGWSSGISTDVSVGYGLNLTSGALEVDTTLIGDGGGETNTASNLGAGAGVYEQKVSLDLQFNSLKSESTSQLTIAEDDPNNTIDFTINTGAVADAAATLTTGDQVYDFVTAQGNVYTKDDTISEDRIVTIAPDYLFKIRANDTYSSSGYFNFGTLNIDDRFGFDLYDANGTSSGRINSYYDIGSTGKNQLTIENVNSTELGRILMTHDGSEEQLTILNKNGADTTLIRMTALGTTIQDDTELNVNTPNFQFTGAGFDVIASTNSVFTTPATQFTGTLRVDTDGSTATSLVGQDVSNRLTAVSLGYGLDLTSGVLLVDSLEYATQYDLSLVSGTTNLTFSGASSPVTLNSSSGNDVTFTQGTGISLAATGTNITITNSGDTNAADDVTTAGGTSGQVPYFNGTKTITSELGLSWNSTNDGLSIISQALLGGRGLNVQQHSTDIGGAASVFVKSRGTFASQTAVVNGDIIGAFVFKGYSGTQYLSDNALFGASTTGTVTTTSVPTSLFFISGATSNYNPDLLIHSGGNVGIGSSGTGDITSTINTPPRQLTVYGETRITDLTTDTPTQVVGADADGDLGALALSGMSVVAGTLTATDASATNELQTITSSSDATSHTVTLSNTGGSIQLVEGSNITLTTSGTAADGVVTIASTGGGATDLTFTGASSPYTLNSSTGTDVTITEGEGIDILRSSNDLTISAPVMTAATGGGAGAVGIVPQPSAGENIEFLRGDATWAAVEYIKGATIETPGSSENVTLFYTRKAITIREVADVVRGTSPSVTWQIKYATTRDSGSPTDLFSASRTTTSTSGATTTTFNDATIGAGNWIWLVTSATSGTNDELSVQLTYTID